MCAWVCGYGCVLVVCLLARFVGFWGWGLLVDYLGLLRIFELLEG